MAFEIKGRVSLDKSKFESASRKVSRMSADMGKKIAAIGSKAIAGAAVVGIAALGVAITKAVKEGAKLETLETTMGVVVAKR